MKDYLGRDLAVGSKVVFLLAGYRDFRKGVVDSFTAQKVRVSYPSPYKGEAREITRRFPSELIAYE